MIEQLFALPFSRRLLVYGSAPAVLVFLYAFLVHLPQSSRIVEAQERIRSLEEARLRLRSGLSEFEQAGIEVKKNEQLFADTKSRFPEQKEIPALLRQVSDLSHEAGLEIVSFRQKPEVFHAIYAAVPVEMALRGNYHQIASFFRKAQTLDRVVNIADTSLKNAQLMGGSVRLEARFSAVTYRLLTAEELHRLAKEKEAETQKKGKSKKAIS